MRNSLILLPLLAFATPAIAQPAPPIASDLQKALNDPATLDRFTGAMRAVSKALLDVPVGDLEAAAEGRKATPSDHRKTLRDVARIDPQRVDQQIAEARPRIERSMKAFSAALPQLVDSLRRASDAIDRAAANLPDPNYPRR